MNKENFLKLEESEKAAELNRRFAFLADNGTIRRCDFKKFTTKLQRVLEVWSITHIIGPKATSSEKKALKKKQDELAKLKKAIKSMTEPSLSSLRLFGGISSSELERLCDACDRAAKPFGRRSRGNAPDREGTNLCAELVSLYSKYASTPASLYDQGDFIQFVCKCFEVVGQTKSATTIRKKLARMIGEIRDRK